MDPLLLFFAAWAIANPTIRFLADYETIRLYVHRVHLHHFIFGLILTPITAVLLIYNDFTVAGVLGGVIMALVLSEAKQLILQDWQP